MQRWSDDDLRLTLRALGLRPVGGNYDTIRRRIAALSIDTSHWRRPNAIAVDDEELRGAVAASVSLAQCLRVLGWSDCGSSRRRLRYFIRLLELDTAHFLGRRSNLGRTFPHRVTPVERYLRLDGPRITSTDLRLKLLDEGIFDPRCVLCDRELWQGKPIPLELDHINGDRYDNRLENLRLLCPNCHALTATYRGRNRGRYADLGA